MLRRRELIAGFGGAVVLPLAARAQQRELPLIGFLGRALPQARTAPSAFFEGLADTGYVVGRDARIEYRWAQEASQMPALAADLVRLQPAVISTRTIAGALAAKAATSTIPIVFSLGDDPVRLGLVASFNRPGGNLTGATSVAFELEAKRFAMMHQIVPAAETIGALVETTNPAAERQISDIRDAARSLGRKVRILRATTDREIDNAFKSIVQEKLGALFVAASNYFTTRQTQIVTLAAHYAIPAFYAVREYPEAGGLLSYGSDINATIRQQGIYVGLILKGERPSDLPVVQPTKFELVINLKTARTLGLDLPITILALADEVID